MESERILQLSKETVNDKMQSTFNLIAVPTTFGLGKILSGTIFAAGLVVVVLAGAELFTGNSLITAAVLEKKTTVSKMLRNWVIVYIANFIGSILVTWMIWKIGLFASGADMFGAITVKVAVGKVNMTFVNCLLSGIMCNWLVSLAVWMATGADSTIGKIFAIFFPIWMFVTCGFEHCIANMYAIPAGIFAASNPLLAIPNINTFLFFNIKSPSLKLYHTKILRYYHLS